MKECNILEVKTYSGPSYIFSGGQDHQINPPGSTSYLTDFQGQ